MTTLKTYLKSYPDLIVLESEDYMGERHALKIWDPEKFTERKLNNYLKKLEGMYIKTVTCTREA